MRQTIHLEESPAFQADQHAVGESRSAFWLMIAVALLLWGVLSRHLGLEWSVNEQYYYGWFVPFFALYLFWLRWAERPGKSRKEEGESRKAGSSNPETSFSIPTFSFLLLFLLLPLRLIEVANPEWRPLGWVHTMVAVGLTLTAIWMVGKRSWLKHFAFPVCFFLVAVPWVTPIETPIVQGLQQMVAAVDAEMMQLLGIPAQLEGSVIRLRTGVVGVNEACSGVRSLQTALMAGLLFGELNRLGWKRRAGLVLAVVLLALVANVLRGAFLVWTAADRGTEAVATVHDLAGNVVLGMVILGSFGFASWLKKGEKGNAKVESLDHTEVAVPRRISTKWLAGILAWLILLEVGVEGWYRLHERNLVAQPRWGVRWPENAPNYQPVKIDEHTKVTLRYDHGGGGAWHDERGEVVEQPVTEFSYLATGSERAWLLYFFRWDSGKSSALRAKAHRPDICFPSSGWQQTADHGVKFFPALPGLALPFRHFEFTHPGRAGVPKTHAHAFFCLQEDKVAPKNMETVPTNAAVTGAVGGWGLKDRFQMVREARRDLGQQVMEVVITTRNQLTAEEAERAFSSKLKRLVVNNE